MKGNGKLVIIDGNSLLFRAYYATSYGSIMRTKDGTPTNAIFAFSNMVSKIIRSFEGGESIFVGFDTDSQTFRKEEYEGYKANRKPAPEDLIPQFSISRELLDALGIKHYEEHGVEADDICGSIAKQAAKQGYQVEIYTSDRDYLQLIDDNITINLLKVGLSNTEKMDEKALMDSWGLTPNQIIDYKGLCGDSSDNLPGVPGIGDKTAIKLIKEYGSLENIIANASSLKGKMGENIRNNIDQAKACYHLATIKIDLELPFGADDLLYEGYDYELAASFANKYELRQMVDRLPLSMKKGSENKEESTSIEIVNSFDKIELPKKFSLCLDIDFSSYHDATLKGIAISYDKSSFYMKVDDLKADENLLKVLESQEYLKSVYDAKATIVALNKIGVKIEGIDFDMLLAGYLLDSTSKNDPVAIFSSLGLDIRNDEKDTSILSTSIANGIGLVKEKAISSLKDADSYSLYTDIEFPLAKLLAQMEIEGFPLNGEKLNELGDPFKQKQKELEEEIISIAGYKFNIASPKQVGEFLYDKLNLPSGKDRSTSSDVLKELIPYNPVVEKILEYRKYSKLVSTYIEGLLPHIKEDGKLHTYFNQAQTSTGRLSSSNPNLQNISAKDEEGKAIRKAFYYENEEYSILSLDYSQIELRILASLSNCKPYIDTFNNGHDVHSETASKIFHSEEVTPLMRRKAKAVNFAIIYGTTPFGLADQIESTPYEAKKIIDSFYMAYPEIEAYLASIIEEVERNGYVKTMFGRRRYLRDINSPSYPKREAARRQALNAPVQGSAADLLKIAMLKVDFFLKEGGYKTKMVLTVHDELLFKVPKEEETIVPEKIKDIMEHAIDLPVKLTVEGKLGRTYFEAKE